ncbi:MAG TPA: hypothetical protein VMZ92_18035, partial [Planctomycetota bacterium]|nr:hypothetical protein [Planctomycetota bacterium]
AGMVGLDRAATPLAPGKLSQEIPWDGTDDAGKKVSAAGCRASVATGMHAKFDRFILHEKDGFAGGGLIVPGLNDEYFIIQSHGTYCRSVIRVLSSQGKFVRGFWPYNLNQPKAKEFLLEPNPVQCERGETGFPHQGIDDWNGLRVPYSVCNDLTFFFHTSYSAAVVTTDGCMVAVPAYAGRVRTSLWRLSPEGFPGAVNWMVPWHPTSYPESKDVAPRQKALWQSGRAGGWKLAAGLDGDFYLADGIHNVVAHYRARDFEPINFTHSGTVKLDPPRNFIGELNTQGDDGNHFNFKFEEKQPFGIAVAADGHILVLDGDVVKTYAPDGRFVEKKPRAADAFKEAPVPEALLAAGRNPRALSFPRFLQVDSAGRLYLSEERDERTISDVDGGTLKRERLPSGHSLGFGYMCVDADDNWYVATQKGYNGYGRIWKFSPDGKPLRFGDRESLDTDSLGRTVQVRGIHVARNGDIYVAVVVPGGKPPGINVYSPEGVLKKEGLVTGLAVNDVAVDREGNIYFLEGVTTFKGVPNEATKHWPPAYVSAEEARLNDDEQIIKRCSLMGRLVKFPPEGGALDGKGGKGQTWSHAGASGLVPADGKPEREAAAQICLDADERIWIPDTLMYSVKAVDRAGNLMVRVGTYGSEDCRGGGGDRRLEGTNIVVDPEVPLARPHGMAVHGDVLLITDMTSHRVVRCRLEYVEKKEVAIGF